MDVTIEAFPNLFRAADLVNSIMLLIMTTSSLNYDLYFFSPAIRSFQLEKINNDGRIEDYNTVMKFLVSEFSIERYASNFIFSDTETADQFLGRFLKHLESQKSVPENVKTAIANLEPNEYHLAMGQETTGFIKPLPIFLTLRVFTLMAELDYGLRKIQLDNNMGSIEEIVKFLTRDFDASLYGEGIDLNEGNVPDIVQTVSFGFVAENKGKDTRLILSDNVQASKKNKDFFLAILPKVPENVKRAIETILPYL